MISNVFLWLAIALYAMTFLVLVVNSLRGRAAELGYSHYLLFAAFSIHSLLLILRIWETGHAPMIGRYETILFFTWSVSLLNLFLVMRYRFRQTEFLTVPVIVLGLGFAALADTTVRPIPLILQTRWFETHVVTSFIAYALFTLSAAAGALWLRGWLKDRDHPPLLLQRITYQATLWGFMLFSLSMALGAIWGYLAWGSYWLWEPKSTASLMLWIYFAGVLHTRFSRAWRGWPAAVLSIVGFGLVLFTYLGVSVFLESTHRM